jgi:hypothetical protein
MEKILIFLKGLPEKYGWRFWVSAVVGFLCAIGTFMPDSGFKWWQAILCFIPMWFLGYFMFMLCLWMWKMIFKGTGKAAKAAGKVAIGAASLAVGGATTLAKGGSSSGTNTNSKSSYSPKQVNRVYTMKYNGQLPGPAFLDVPSYSSSSTARPSRDEIIAALENLGYDHQRAKDLAHGGSDRVWTVVS